MFPQTELDNYKLQVELLQEKLKRSEENRKQLEERFDGIMRKRSEQEKAMKVKSKVKYKQFLEEQRERNERNKALVKLLERVDQQAAALAARSERLKMMKLQYELYFARLLQMQSLRSVQSSPGQISVLPLNNIITNANLPVGIQDICQSSSNLSKVSPTISENWGMMPNNTSPASSNLPYRFPANVDYFNGQILLSQEPLQRQVNLKSTFGDSMGPSIGYPAQIGTFADTRRNPIEFEHYKPLELSMAQGHQEIPAAGRLRSPRPDSHNRNLNEMQSLGQMSSENDFHGRRTFDGYGDQNGYGTGYPAPTPQQSSETHRPPYQMLTSDKLHGIKQDSSRERLAAEVNEDDKKTDAVEEDDEKSQPMSTARRDITPMDEPKQKTEGPRKSMPPPVESSMKKVQDLFPTDKLLNNPAALNAERPRTPVMWNFGGRIDPPPDSNQPIQLGKKEKLSMENIEDAIYGERITPVSKKKEIVSEQPERRRVMEMRTFREVSLPKPVQSFRDTDSHEEKSDSSEKEFKIGLREEPPIINIIGSNPPTPVSSKPSTPVGSKPSTPVSSKPSTPVSSKPSTPVSSKPSTPVKENSPYTPQELRREQDANIPASDQTSIQQYPEGYSKSYEEPVPKDVQYQEERKPVGPIPTAAPSPSYSNYEYDEKKAPEQISPKYDSNAAAIQQATEVPQEPQAYPDEQYQPEDYQYQGQMDYNQQQGYDYQGDQYQGEYMQEGYDPNAYYGYDQQGEGQVYQQEGGPYQGEGVNYQQGDVSYQQQVDGAYQQGSEVYPQVEGGYQQGDGTYQGSESYQQGTEAYQSDPAYQNQNQPMYPQGDYNQQPYATPAYPTEYSGAEYANYDDQGTAQLTQQKAQEFAPQQAAVSSEEQEKLAPEVSSNVSNPPAAPEVPQESPKNQEEKLPEDTKTPAPATPAVKPPSILSTEKPAEPNPNKKKKKVNFVDSETDESSSAPKPQAAAPTNDESDFDFSSN